MVASWVEGTGEVEAGRVYGRGGSVCCGAVTQVELSARDVVSGSLHVQPGPSMSQGKLAL